MIDTDWILDIRLDRRIVKSRRLPCTDSMFLLLQGKIAKIHKNSTKNNLSYMQNQQLQQQIHNLQQQITEKKQ